MARSRLRSPGRCPRAGCTASIFRWFPYTDHLPEEQRDVFLEAVVDHYLAANPVDAEGRTHVKMVRLEIEAELI